MRPTYPAKCAYFEPKSGRVLSSCLEADLARVRAHVGQGQAVRLIGLIKPTFRTWITYGHVTQDVFPHQLLSHIQFFPPVRHATESRGTRSNFVIEMPMRENEIQGQGRFGNRLN